MKMEVVRNGAPKSLWVYLNARDPLVAWACYRGVLYPSEFFAKNKPGTTPLGLRAYSVLYLAVKKNKQGVISSEVLLEDVRRRYYPDKISRLTGMFAFQDSQSAKQGETWGLRHFEEEYLVELCIDPFCSCTVVDSNWFTYLAGNGLAEDVAHSYWRGEAYPGKEPIWEVLFDSPALVSGTDLRMKCLDSLRPTMPNSLFLLDISRIAGELGFTLGAIVPFLTVKDGSPCIIFHIDMEDFGATDFRDALEQYSGPKLPCSNLKIIVPDFKRRELKIDQNDMLTILNNTQSGVSGVLLHPGLQKTEK